LEVYKQRVPLGVLAVIYESRPNVTVDVTGLALKSGNAAILRGGSETLHTNRALVSAIQAGLRKSGLPDEAIQFIDSIDRRLVNDLLKLHEWVDLVIPRGGASLHKYCKENSQIPVLVGGIGICHLFVDESADLAKSVEIIHNAKVQRPSVCNALDTVLVHRAIASTFLPGLTERLIAAGVKFKLDPTAEEFFPSPLPAGIEKAGPEDFDREWLSLTLGVKVVDGLQAAIDHIAAHSTGHSDGILTESEVDKKQFLAQVDSAVVYVNASTRFTDGGQLGLGAEVAVSTQRLHARGPMGLEALTSYKWVVIGNGQIRE
jgi:glutamate-5-semialdehyde dehydrogenase